MACSAFLNTNQLTGTESDINSQLYQAGTKCLNDTALNSDQCRSVCQLNGNVPSASCIACLSSKLTCSITEKDSSGNLVTRACCPQLQAALNCSRCANKNNGSVTACTSEPFNKDWLWWILPLCFLIFIVIVYLIFQYVVKPKAIKSDHV